MALLKKIPKRKHKLIATLMLLAWKIGYEKGYDFGWCERDEGKPHDENFGAHKSEGSEHIAANDVHELMYG